MLQKFGLTATEEKVYLALLKAGESAAADIIKITQLHRTTVYDVLERLIGKGFAGYIVKNKIKFYQGSNPSKFLDIAQEEKNKAEEKKKFAKEIISKMNLIQKDSKVKSIAQIFVGKDGQKTVMKDIINEGKNFIEFGAGGSFKEELPVYTEQWAKERRRKKIFAKIIAAKGADAPIWKMNKIKFIPEEYQSPAATIVYGSKVAIFIHEKPILIILIESKKLSQSYKSYFHFLWKKPGSTF